MTETITEHLERLIPQGTTCTGCPYRKRVWLCPFCTLSEEFIRRNDKHCIINDPREVTLEIIDIATDLKDGQVYVKVKQ